MSNLGGLANMYFMPTDMLECYRMLLLFRGSVSYMDIDDFTDLEYFDDSNFNMNQNWCRHAINYKEFEKIEAEVSLSSYTVLDPFAGKGEWLATFAGCDQIAIEIDKNRFDEIPTKYKIHGAFEEVDLPKSICDVLLFNPPYGDSDGVRNVKRYLNMILERNLLCDNGLMISVIREDDFIECFQEYWENFDIEFYYKVNQDEFDKYKQYVIFSRKKKKFDSKTTQGSMEYTAALNSLKTEIANGVEFNDDLYLSFTYWSKRIDFKEKWGKLELKKSLTPPSSFDRVWKWIVDDNKAKIATDMHLTVPKPPKPSEIANILASGYINGRIDDVKAPHIVAAGIKDMVSREIEQIPTENGSKTKTTEIRYSRPQLSILYKKDGKIKIKEIASGEQPEHE